MRLDLVGLLKLMDAAELQRLWSPKNLIFCKSQGIRAFNRRSEESMSRNKPISYHSNQYNAQSACPNPRESSDTSAGV